MALWFEITARVSPAEVEAVAELMRSVSPAGVTIDEPVDILGPEMGFSIRRNEPVAVRVYLPSSELGAVLTDQLRQSVQALPGVELVARPLYQEDWEVSWREFFGVVDSGSRIIIVPSWIEHEPRPEQLVIRLDPGQAFGTGHHETTRMCLAALEELLGPGDAVLDVGTGSGVLAIAAAKLGAGSVLAIDIDPVAAGVAVANCEVNGVTGVVSVRAGTFDAAQSATYDDIVANISSAANTALAPLFAAVTRPGGRLILSGILASDARDVADAIEAAGFELQRLTYDGEWCLLAFAARAPQSAS